MTALKDQRLAEISDKYNVARFASFDPAGNLRYSVGIENQSPRDVDDAVRALLQGGRTVNVRTFLDDASKSTDFLYGIESAIDAAASVRRYARQGLYTIVNETVDVADGGVSGVSMSGVTEFGPGSTPRIVEDAERSVAQLETSMAWTMLGLVYRIEPPVLNDQDRVEFSVHPNQVGHRGQHVLVWEVGPANEAHLTARPTWPNDFSRHIGDKVFGLLVAHLLGFPVPATTVIPRRIAPFTFGTSTGTGETWTRTAPSTADPGYYTTARGWIDPFSLLMSEDPQMKVAAVIAQEGVPPAYSGGAASREGGTPLVEGVSRSGLDFMAGAAHIETLPKPVVEDVRDIVYAAQRLLGGVQLEWVHDGTRAWIVQLHTKASASPDARRLSSGDADGWLPFDPSDGLDALRDLVSVAGERRMGIEVLRHVGVTSHVGDILRKARIPARFSVA